ncbi:hypothetical protein OH76DRAFT_101809 [Lentinus brumalis]|uniref:DUF7918 domain-containing protein n=1 Tax=Lentinus brumalis TaxID=2498619 RepID=A0A371CQ88_9APHY|nr:hypothetical protein OH76DRAFT_101809 [Polyporus brumalis]
MRVGNFEVWLTCEDQRLPEYAVERKENQVTCFVPSEAGKQFTIHGKNDYDETIALFSSFDGSVVTSTAVVPGESKSKRGVQTGPSLFQNFQFAELVTCDEEDGSQRHDAASLGSIEVKGWRMRWDKTQSGTSAQKPTAFQPTARVHERSKKAGTHCIALGAPVTTKETLPAPNWHAEYLDKSPIVMFLFRYRHLALLQAQDIAPLSQPNLQAQPGGSEPDANQLDVSQSQSQGGISRSQPAPSRQRALTDLQEEGSRPAKRARVGSEDEETKADVDAPAEDEGELSTLKSSANALQGQLQQLMRKIDRMERKKTRKTAGARSVTKKEEATEGGLVSGEVIDLTLDD